MDTNLNVYVHDNLVLKENIHVDLPFLNLVVIGDIESDCDLIFKVDNFVQIGKISTTRVFLIEANHSYHFGEIQAKKLQQKKVHEVSHGYSEKNINKVKEMGITILATQNGYEVDFSLGTSFDYAQYINKK